MDILEEQERDIKRLKQALARIGTGGVTDHGALSGLGDNDHPQYSLTSHTHTESDITDLDSYLPLSGGLMTGYIQVEDQERIEWLNATGGSASLGIDPTEQDVFRLRLGGTATATNEFRIEEAGDSLVASFTGGNAQFNGDVTVGDDIYMTAGNGILSTGTLIVDAGGPQYKMVDGGTKAEFQIDNGSTQFDGDLRITQEASGSSIIGFYNSGWKTHHTLAETTQDFYVDGNIALHLEEGTTSTSSSGYRGSYIFDNVALGSTAGNRRYVGGFRFNVSNSVFLDFLTIRTIAGTTWSTASIGVQRRTDASNQSSMWFDSTYIGFGVSDPDGYAGYTFNGRVNSKPSTTGSTHAGAWGSLGGGYYSWYRNTSSERYKHDIDYGTEWLARIDLSKATATFLHDDGQKYISFIAERVHEAFSEDDRAVVRDDESGLIENFQRDAVTAVLVEKIARLERAVEAHGITL